MTMSCQLDPVDALWEWLKEDESRTQQQLATVCNVTLQTVWRWLHRKTKPTGEAAFRLERELGIPAASWWPNQGAA